METQPLARTEDRHNAETPEDVAILYSWANLEGAKYRDFSANRREYRAQMRHRAAEQLRLMELRAQSEAEASAAQAEFEAAAAHAEADAATVKLAASRAMPAAAQTSIKEEEVEIQRRSSLREAAQQARKAAAERLEAARRAEAAALADSIARREEREIAEAQASALRQAAQYAEAEARSRQKKASQQETPVPGRISDPYGPQPLPEGEYFERPGTPVAELAASRFRQQREYIEQSTGAELPSFRVPNVSGEQRAEQAKRAKEAEVSSRDIPQRRTARDLPAQAAAEARTASARLEPERAARVEPRSPIVDGSLLAYAPEEIPAELPPRPQPKPVYEDRYLSIARDPHRLDEAGAQTLRREYSKPAEPGPQGRVVIPSIPYKEFRRAAPAASGSPAAPMAEVVSRLPATPQNTSRVPEDISFESSLPGERAPAARAPESQAPPLREPTVPSPSRKTNPSSMQSPVQNAGQTATESSGPAWLYPQQPASGRSGSPNEAPLRLGTSLPDRSVGAIRPGNPGVSHPGASKSPSSGTNGDTLQHSREQVASRWYALKGLFAPDSDQNSIRSSRVSGSAPSMQDHSQAVRSPIAGGQTANEAQLSGDRHLPRDKRRSTPLVVIFSLAGGVGKTSLVATLGRALSSLGEKVLLTDTTSHGLLPFYFGASELHAGMVRTFLPPIGSTDAPIHIFSCDPGRDPRRGTQSHWPEDDPGEAMVDDLVAKSQCANRVLLDVDPSCAWLLGRLARLKPTILVPLAADMNSVISLQAVERCFNGMQDAAGSRLRPFYLLNQFDASLPLQLDVREALSQQLGDRLLPFVIRRSAAVSEALAEGMTIVDYDPTSEVVRDYLCVADWLRADSAPTEPGLSNMRWSER